MAKNVLSWVAAVHAVAGLGWGGGGVLAQEGEGEGPLVVFRMVCLKNVAGKGQLHLGPEHVKGLPARREGAGGGPARPAEGALTLPQNNFSPRMFARPVDGEFVFYLRPVGGEEVEGGGETAATEVAARAVFPAGIPGEVMLLFVPAPEGAAGGLSFQVAVIDADERAFPAGTHLLYNLTGSQVRGRFGAAGFGMNPGQRHLAGAVETAHPRGYFEVLLEQRRIDAGAEAPWERLANAQWQADRTARRLCLIFDDAGRGRIAVRTFNDYLLPAEAPALPPADLQPRPDDGLTKEESAP